MGEAKRRARANAGSAASTGRKANGKTVRRRFLPSRLTWKSVGLFLLTLAFLDLALYLVFEFGFGQCYGVLCLFQ